MQRIVYIRDILGLCAMEKSDLCEGKSVSQVFKGSVCRLSDVAAAGDGKTSYLRGAGDLGMECRSASGRAPRRDQKRWLRFHSEARGHRTLAQYGSLLLPDGHFFPNTIDGDI